MTAQDIKPNQADYSPPNVNYWGDRCCRMEAALKKIAELESNTEAKAIASEALERQ